MNTQTAPYPGTQAVLRAIELLKAFPPDSPERSLPELAEAVGLNRTTTYRLLSALQSEGMVEREGARYRLGPEIVALGARASGTGQLRAAARTEMAALADATGETVSIEVLVGRDVLILDEVSGRYVVGTVPSVGTRWPAHATSTGKVLLAFATAETLTEFLSAPRARLTPRTIVDTIAFGRELVRVQERGYAVTREELEAGFVAAAVPVHGPSGAVVASLSVGGPKSRLTAERVSSLIPPLQDAAARISSRLGYQPIVPRRAGRRRP
jgi:DNA-binding IclR family transcriptional regulator